MSDEIVRAIGKVVFNNAQVLARMTVDETKMGNIDDKVEKCRNKSRNIYYALKGKISRGVLNQNLADGIIEIAKPLGVIGCNTPNH
ncbi:MAG: hypothetical protein LBP35_03945 [Candidatus Ancillula trichonymphae]|nr:hypothetical protein [Candidatus Ancillula trichonymphae]